MMMLPLLLAAALWSAGQTAPPAVRQLDRAPRLLAPPANARVPYLLRFRWSGVLGAAAYSLQVAEDEKFRAPLLVDRTAADRTYEIALPATGPLWWRVRAVDAKGTPGPWSAARRLNILPPPLAESVFAITLIPAGVTGGESTAGVVALTGPAPAGGATVPLSASDSTHLVLPPRVLLEAGKISAEFRIDTKEVTAETAAQIFAHSRTETRKTTLIIAPPRPRVRLISVGLNPAIITAGNAAEGTVTVSGPAPSELLVQLGSADTTRASVPSSVTILSGAFSARFQVQIAHDTGSGSLDITASLDGDTRTAALNVRGAAAMEPLRAPVPLAPGEGAVVAHDGPAEFAWNEVVGAASYTIEVSENGDFMPPLAATRTIPTLRLIITPLPRGAAWWRVCANDANGAPGRWSTPRALVLE